MTNGTLNAQQQAMTVELESLRQMIMMAKGSGDPFFSRINEALKTQNLEKMRACTQQFDSMSAQERADIMGCPESQDEPWCSD